MVFLFYRQLESECSSNARIHQQLEKASSDLEASLGDLEASRIANMLLKQQVSISALTGSSLVQYVTKFYL